MSLFGGKKPPPPVGSRFAEASDLVRRFGEGDDSVLTEIVAIPWNRDDGATATLYRLAQEAWGTRISRIGERFARDMAYGRGQAATAFAGLRSGTGNLRRFADWGAFDEAARKALLDALARSLERMGASMEEEAGRNPDLPAAMLAEIKDFRKAAVCLSNAVPAGSEPVGAEVGSNAPRRRILLPKEGQDVELP